MFEAQQPEEDKVFLGGKIKEPGFYKCEIVRAWESKADTGSIGIKMELITNQGQTISNYINTVKKDGSPNDIGFDTIQKVIMPLTGLKTLREKPNDTMSFYDFDVQSDVERKVTSYPQLSGKEIGILVKYDGEYYGKPQLRVDSFYHPDTRQTAHEFVNKLEAKACENRLQWVLGQSAETKHIEQKAETNGKTATYSEAPSPNNFDDFDSDIPF